MNIACFIDGHVGLKIAEIFGKHKKNIDMLILTDESDEKYKSQILKNVQCGQVFKYSEFVNFVDNKQTEKKFFDLGLLCWWPKIVKQEILDLAYYGFLNFHPSFLPYGRGKHPNFWTFVDDTPFGVSLHWVDKTIDGGEIAFQQEIDKSWIENGESLYTKAINEILSLFDKNFLNIISGDIPRVPFDNTGSIVRYSKELEEASKISLDKTYTARHLINLLRARTFTSFPACWFQENGKKYEIRIEIREV